MTHETDVQTVEFCGEIRRATERAPGQPKAYLVFDGINEVWIPASQVIEKRRVSGADYILVIPEWLARQKGIV